MTTQGTIDEATSELLNDDGAKVAPGRGDCAHLFYCGRVNYACSTLDRRCKTQRSQCASCERFQRTPAAIAAMKDVQKTPAPATVKALPTDAEVRAEGCSHIVCVCGAEWTWQENEEQAEKCISEFQPLTPQSAPRPPCAHSGRFGMVNAHGVLAADAELSFSPAMTRQSGRHNAPSSAQEPRTSVCCELLPVIDTRERAVLS